jgi:hypothetical protein
MIHSEQAAIIGISEDSLRVHRALQIPTVVIIAVKGVEPQVSSIWGRIDQRSNCGYVVGGKD